MKIDEFVILTNKNNKHTLIDTRKLIKIEKYCYENHKANYCNGCPFFDNNITIKCVLRNPYKWHLEEKVKL